MSRALGHDIPLLPLVLWDTPPAVEMVLSQEGVPFTKVRDLHPLAFHGGRFVLYDSRRMSAAKLQSALTPVHTAIDLEAFRYHEPDDPFVALIDTKSAPATWRAGGFSLTERVSRFPKAAIRERLIRKLRETIARAGGLWARLAPYPFPFRSAFNFRADLDEPYPDDYARFARARASLEDCTTHFVSTHAYGGNRKVLDDLRRFDTQSHGHFHVVYRDEASNRRNIIRAHVALEQADIAPVAFVAPEGRWNVGLDTVLEEMDYEYASEFHLGYDDLPFFPWRGDRFSRVLQMPIHPICEGLFLDNGARDMRAIGEYLARVVRAKIESGEPAFVYGHPERRLGRAPQILDAIAAEIAGEALLWRVTLTDFARWWRWRLSRRWAVVERSEGRFELQFEDWDSSYPVALEILRGDHVAALPVFGPIMALRMDGLAYERRRRRSDRSVPARAPQRRDLRAAVRAVLDWETVTPVDELQVDTFRARLKRGLRRWRATGAARRGGPPPW
jgi:hypothetical protein